jgi:hypothetical protein
MEGCQIKVIASKSFMKSAYHVDKITKANIKELIIQRLRILLAQEQKLALHLNGKLKVKNILSQNDHQLIIRLNKGVKL